MVRVERIVRQGCEPVAHRRAAERHACAVNDQRRPPRDHLEAGPARYPSPFDDEVLVSGFGEHWLLAIVGELARQIGNVGRELLGLHHVVLRDVRASFQSFDHRVGEDAVTELRRSCASVSASVGRQCLRRRRRLVCVSRLTWQGSFARGLHKLGANESPHRIAKIDAVGVEQILRHEHGLACCSTRQIKQLIA